MSKHNGKVLIAAPVHPELTEGLSGLGYECVKHEKITQQQAYELIKDCVGVITSTRLQLDKSLIDAAPMLKWIGRMGSGMEVIDLEYARLKGIACFGSPEGNCNAVGEHALGMLLALIRRIVWSNNEMKDHVWLRDENRGTELEGKTVGIIGYGHTGRAFAKKLQGFDVSICAYDKYSPAGVQAHVHNCNSLNDLFARADIVSFHVPLQPDTRHYFNEEFISRMQKPFVLVNTSRGPVVDTLALYHGLKSGKIKGACLDVFEQEPVAALKGDAAAAMEEMIAMPNVVVTPHIAGYTHEALYKMSKTLLDKLVALGL